MKVTKQKNSDNYNLFLTDYFLLTKSQQLLVKKFLSNQRIHVTFYFQKLENSFF